MSIKNTLDNPYQTVKDMADNKKMTGQVPKPRDPMAKALALPQYQPKVTPSKKGQLDKAIRKHKGRDVHEAFDASSEAEVVEEGVMGMTQMDSMLPRLLTLAGCPPMDDQETNTIEITQPEMQDTMVGSNWDACDASNDVSVEEFPPEIELPQMTTMQAGLTSNIQVIRDSFNAIRTNLPEIKVSEFAEMRAMVADLMSQIDRMGNHISGK